MKDGIRLVQNHKRAKRNSQGALEFEKITDVASAINIGWETVEGEGKEIYIRIGKYRVLFGRNLVEPIIKSLQSTLESLKQSEVL